MKPLSKKIQKAIDKKFFLCRHWLRRAKESGTKFRRSDLKRLEKSLNAKADFLSKNPNLPNVLSTDSMNAVMAFFYSHAIRFSKDGLDLELFSPLEELIYNENPLLKLVSKDYSSAGAAIPIPTQYQECCHASP